MQTASLEAPRGVRQVSVRSGFAQVRVEREGAPSPEWVVTVLRALAEAKVSHKFLKLSSTGLSFIVPGAASSAAREALTGSVAVDGQVAIVTVECPNVREIAGLVAAIASQALSSEIEVLHSGDMHDRVYLVVRDADVERAVYAVSGELR